ncbi:MAG: ABC transporter ATP-binding protein [Treponemataceae bacterium]
MNDPILVAEGLGKIYSGAAGDFRALSDVSLEASSGDFIAITGKSGSGKSTLINLITGIDRPSAGSILVAGESIGDMSEKRLARWRGTRIGVVFQFFQLLPTLTVAENVMLPMDFCGVWPVAERRGRAVALLERVGIAEQADKLPAALSGGQQQRAAIARALANDPLLIAADEPTGNLDSHTAEAVLSLFGDLAAEGKAVLMVSHERDLGSHATREIALRDGRVLSREAAYA